MKIIGTMRALDDTRGAVRVEDVYDTDIDDLWEACTTPERLARWIAEVSGDLREGGTVHAVFTSTWSGPATDRGLRRPAPSACSRRSRARTTRPRSRPGSPRRVPDHAGGRGARPAGRPLHFYGAGWQVHLEDLGRSLASDGPVHVGGWSEQTPAPAWHARWTELTPKYQDTAVG